MTGLIGEDMCVCIMHKKLTGYRRHVGASADQFRAKSIKKWQCNWHQYANGVGI